MATEKFKFTVELDKVDEATFKRLQKFYVDQTGIRNLNKSQVVRMAIRNASLAMDAR